MNMPSFYQADLFRSLVATGEVDLQVIFAGDLPIGRRQLGWAEDLEGYSATFLSGQRARHKNRYRMAAQQAIYHRDRLNIVNGIWAEPTFVWAIVSWLKGGGSFAIYSEAQQPNLRRYWVKKVVQTMFGKVVARSVAGVFPISQFATDFYRHLGVPEKKIYPFGYFRDHRWLSAPQLVQHEPMEVIYVGQFIRRKGLDVLLSAMAPFWERYPHLVLTLVGQGEEEEALRQRVEQKGWQDRVCLEVPMPASQIMERIRRASLLVLPSYWDGWGLVVNESLAMGVPAIVSDHCGAADLIEDGVNGYRFSAGNVADLRAKLAVFLAATPAQHEQMRQKAAERGQQISATQAATYLVGCCRHILGLSPTRPLPMWEHHL